MPEQPQLPPIDYACDTVEALRAERGPARRRVYWAGLGLLAVGLLALPLVKVDVAVRGPGLVRPVGEVGEVRSPVAGLVRSVLAAEHARVGKGQPLVEIASPVLDERIDHNRRQAEENADLLADLGALLGGELPDDAHPWRSALKALEATRHRAALAAAAQRIAKLERDRARLAGLHARGLISDRDLDDAAHAIAEESAARELLAGDARAGWEAERRQLERRRDALATEARQLAEEKALHLVRAPAGGDLLGIEGLREGQFVPAGQPLAVVSPDGGLRVEARVDSRAVGFLREGLRARVQIDAFPHTEFKQRLSEDDEINP